MLLEWQVCTRVPEATHMVLQTSEPISTTWANSTSKSTLQPAAAAVGPGGGASRVARGGIDWGGDTPKDYTKPRQTIQSPEKIIQTHKYKTKTVKY